MWRCVDWYTVRGGLEESCHSWTTWPWISRNYSVSNCLLTVTQRHIPVRTSNMAGHRCEGNVDLLNSLVYPSERFWLRVLYDQILQDNIYLTFVQKLLQWKSNEHYIFWVRACSFSYPACKAHAPYFHLWPAPLCNILPLYLKNGTIFENKKGHWI